MGLLKMLAEISHAERLSGLELVERFGWIRYFLLRTIWRRYVAVDPVSGRFHIAPKGVDLLSEVEDIVWPGWIVQIEPDTFAWDALRASLAEAAFITYPEVRYDASDRSPQALKYALRRAWAADEAERALRVIDEYAEHPNNLKARTEVERDFPVVFHIGVGGLWI